MKSKNVTFGWDFGFIYSSKRKKNEVAREKNEVAVFNRKGSSSSVWCTDDGVETVRGGMRKSGERERREERGKKWKL